MDDTKTPAYAHLNVRMLPVDRGSRYEDPLHEALEPKGFANLVGGGTLQARDGEVKSCGLDIDIVDLDNAVSFICEFLAEKGAPKGSKLQYEHDGRKHEIPFGSLEGLAVYFNGTDLPDKVYEECDINHVYTEIDGLLGDRGEIQGQWQGPTETALYLYGYDAAEMKELIADLMQSYPLCEGARYETIA